MDHQHHTMKFFLPGLTLMLVPLMANPAISKDVTCFKRQMDGWDKPAFYLPDKNGSNYDFFKDITPYSFRATGGWKSYRMGERNDNFQKGVCSI